MKITLGLHLDGERGWHPAHRLGEPIVGPMGLLDLLETQLGLLRAECAHAERIVQFRDCLKRCDRSDRFFHASFAIDPLGTAGMLLSWRDAWWLHGWNGELKPGACARLQDMAAAEAEARHLLSPSMGERLAEVAKALSRRPRQIESVELTDPIATFPKRWRDVLAMLPLRSTRNFASAADARSVLGKLQAALARAHAGERPAGKIAWVDDGSLRAVRAETTLSAARWAAHELQKHPADVALVAERDRSLLDTTLDAADVPRAGFQEASAFAPALQVLPLALATLWEPLDVYALLQFLSHPIGPIPGRARRRLAELVADCPGIGGPRWRATLEKIAQDNPERATDMREAVAFWVEHPRYSPAAGAPIEALRERARRIRDYFGARLADQDPVRSAASSTGYAQAAAVTAALEALLGQGETLVTRAGLQALLSQCTARGAPNFAMRAQVGRVPAVSNPGALIEPFERVIWWQMAAPALPRHYPWTRSELAALAAAGADLPPLSALLVQQSTQWLRPVLNARKSLVLVLPPPGEEVHPLWQEIQWFVEGIRPEPLEQLLTDPRATDLTPVASAPLPRRKRWWQLPPETAMPPRERESYSSLNTFLNSPYQWVLQHVARLRPSNLLAVTDQNRLYGNLAHRLIDRFFRSDGTHKLEGAALQDWLAREFERVVADEGAVLLMPGRRADFERVRFAVTRALQELQRQFVHARVVRVESERKLIGAFAGGALEGMADLVVRNQAERQGIVDMKWSGATYYRDRFSKNRHLQLAIYAELLRQETGAWPETSYFILSAASLLARETAFFPEARSVQTAAEVSTPLLWQQFVNAWQWRRAQIDRGSIEVAVEGIDPTEASQAPGDALQPEALPQDFNDYRWLAGWGD